MATEFKKIILRRGTGTPPTDLAEGELAFQTDTDKLFVGTGAAAPGHYKQVANLTDMDITATTAELNVLDGVTATTAELNILDGVTATTAELNILDGVTATTTEINYLSGVSSNIQTQLILAQNPEWGLVSKVTSATAGILIDSANLGEAFDFTAYDYKLVFELSTTGETAPQQSNLFFDNQDAGQYSFVFTSTVINGFDSENVVTASEWGQFSTFIPLAPTPTDVGVTPSSGSTVHTLQGEMTIIRPYQLGLDSGNSNLGFIIKGEGVTGLLTTSSANPNTSYSATGFATFAGTYDRASNITEVNIVSGFDDGTNDSVTVRVYKRVR